MNILSFDIEEWYLERMGANRAEKFREFDRLLDHILESLDDSGSSATFFCLGKIATDFPEVISKIQAQGHEIGSHSNLHKWVNKMSEGEFLEDTRHAVDAIEDVTGVKVKSFRAPAFSIGESNMWAFDVLAECGIENDASVFPSVRDFGGFPDFKSQSPCVICHNGFQINEYPIPMAKLPIVGKEVAFSGGGYFRLFPYWFVNSHMKGDYTMSYFHIGDLLGPPEKMWTREEYEEYFKEPGTYMARIKRYFKDSVGRANILSKFDRHLAARQYLSIRDAQQLALPTTEIILRK